jgi:hypothetical protein
LKVIVSDLRNNRILATSNQLGLGLFENISDMEIVGIKETTDKRATNFKILNELKS